MALLWTDTDGQWKPLLPTLQKTLPQLYLLGPYAPEERQGPVIWLKCIVGRTLPDITPDEGVVPILYLPNVGRQDLRAASDCDPMLQPLIELQYRGEVWHQRNGRDWTVEAFLTSEDALALDIARDSRTHDAMLRALPLLAQEPLAGLRKQRLDADDFDRLAIRDPARDLLTWMSDPEAFEKRSDTDRWDTFCDVCAREFDFDPRTSGIQAVADALTEGGGKWDEGLATVLRRAKILSGCPPPLCERPVRRTYSAFSINRAGQVLNEEQENKLQKELEVATNLAHGDACDKVAALDEEHKGAS